jgi:hypothetical protein
MTRRPDPGRPFRPGTHWEVRQAKGWTLAPEPGRCDQKMRSGWHCLEPTRATIGGMFWCGRHMDGRWIAGSAVMEWYLVDDEARDVHVDDSRMVAPIPVFPVVAWASAFDPSRKD